MAMPEPVLDDLAHYRLATEIAGMDVPELCLPEHHDVVIGRMRLHYLDWATADRPRIDFLHDTAEVDSIEELVEKAALFNPLRDRRLLRWSLRRNLRRLPNGRWIRKTDMRWLHRDARTMAARFQDAWRGESSVT